MPLVLGGQGAPAPAFTVANSCRFNGVNGYLTKTLGTPTDIDAWTFSCWYKKCSTAAEQCVITGRADASNEGLLKWDTNSNGYWYDHQGGMTSEKISDAVYRDPVAWFHFCFTWDSGDGVAEDRQRIYINGVRVTDFSTSTNPSSGQDSVINSAVDHYIGASGAGTTMELNGYLAEVVLIDGLSLEPTSFGQFNEDSPTIWEPIDPSGLTFGDNGFYLDFEDSADLGNDVSGKDNDWALNNIDAADQATDTPTNNFCTMNPLENFYSAATFAEGNCKLTMASETSRRSATFHLSSGKWYWEVNCATSTGNDWNLFGISDRYADAIQEPNAVYAYDYSFTGKGAGSSVYHGSVASSYGDGYSDGEVIGHYMDLDNNKMYWAIDGVIQNSGTGFSIGAVASTQNGWYTPTISDWTDIAPVGVYEANFGGCPSFTVSSGNTDANDYGNFEYSPNDGGSASFDGSAKDFLAICTKNLATDGG